MSTGYVIAILAITLASFGGFAIGRKTRTYPEGSYLRRQGRLRFPYGEYDIWSFDGGKNWLTPAFNGDRSIIAFVPAPPALLKQLGALHEIFIRTEEGREKNSERAVQLRNLVRSLDPGADWSKG